MAKRLINLSDVIYSTGLSKTNIYRKINSGEFPKPVPLGAQKIAFLESEIEDWISARLKARDAGEGEQERRAKARNSVLHTQHVQAKLAGA